MHLTRPLSFAATVIIKSRWQTVPTLVVLSSEKGHAYIFDTGARVPLLFMPACVVSQKAQSLQ